MVSRTLCSWSVVPAAHRTGTVGNLTNVFLHRHSSRGFANIDRARRTSCSRGASSMKRIPYWPTIKSAYRKTQQWRVEGETNTSFVRMASHIERKGNRRGGCKRIVQLPSSKHIIHFCSHSLTRCRMNEKGRELDGWLNDEKMKRDEGEGESIWCFNFWGFAKSTASPVATTSYHSER